MFLNGPLPLLRLLWRRAGRRQPAQIAREEEGRGRGGDGTHPRLQRGRDGRRRRPGVRGHHTANETRRHRPVGSNLPFHYTSAYNPYLCLSP